MSEAQTREALELQQKAGQAASMQGFEEGSDEVLAALEHRIVDL
jgi:hypothetical protein